MDFWIDLVLVYTVKRRVKVSSFATRAQFRPISDEKLNFVKNFSCSKTFRALQPAIRAQLELFRFLVSQSTP